MDPYAERKVKKDMTRKTILAGTLIAAVALAAGAEGKAVALGETLPGQTEATVTDTVVLADRKTHESLRHPFVMLYYVEPTLTVGDTAKISYYVTLLHDRLLRQGEEAGLLRSRLPVPQGGHSARGEVRAHLARRRFA